jgi:hypothetical protein
MENNKIFLFYEKYGINPTQMKFENFLKQSIALCQKTISKQSYNGLLKTQSLEQYDFLKKVGQHCHDILDADFEFSIKSIQISIHSIKIMQKFLIEMLKNYNQVQEEMESEQIVLLKFIDKQAFIDTRALFQLFTGDSKNESISFIKKLKSFQNISENSLIRKFIDQKATSKPAFIWCRKNLSIICSNKQSKVRLEFNEVNRSHYIPLYFDDYSIDQNENKINIIIENDDTAIALSSLSEFHSFDLIMCAGGENNVCQNFLKVINILDKSTQVKWKYFGDYDFAGFKIFRDLVFNFHKIFHRFLKISFLRIIDSEYKKILLRFGKSILQEDTEKKKFNYSEFLQMDDDYFHPLLLTIQTNLKLGMELEQNILIYLFNEHIFIIE